MLPQDIVGRRHQMPERRPSQHEPLARRVIHLIREIRSPADDQPIRKRWLRANHILRKPRLESRLIDAADRPARRALHTPYRPLNTGSPFSMKLNAPSRWSSVVKRYASEFATYAPSCSTSPYVDMRSPCFR